MSLSPTLFINPYQNPYVNTVDNNGLRQRGNIIDSATATTGQALATAGTLASKPIFNGEGWYFEFGAEMTTGSTSDYNFIHDGSNFDIWVTVFICPTASTTYQRTIICNNGFSTTARGILLRANATSGNNRLECNVGNGSASFITLGANSALTVNATNTIRVRRSGSNATMWVNGVQVATQTISLSSGVGNAAGVMTIATAVVVSVNYYFKDLVIFNRALTSGEVTSMNNRTFMSITPEPTNVYIEYGDSNDAGRGSNASIAPDLVGNIDGSFIETYSSTPNSSSWIGRLLLGTNQTIPSENPATLHGSEMRFGKSMGAVKEHCIIKWGRGSHSMFARGGANSPDFNISSASGAYLQTLSALALSISDLVHSQRRTPVFRGITPIIGANDATFANQGNAWTRTGATITITRSNHGLAVGAVLGIYNSNDLTIIPNGIYTITAVTTNTFTIHVPSAGAGATSGTVSYSGAYNFKQNSYDTINGIIVYLTSNVRNQITAGTGYTVDKVRIYFPQTKATGINAEGLSQVQTAQSAMGTDFLTDNPARSGNVLGSFSESTAALPMQDGVHYSTVGYDELGTMRFNYFDDYINE